NQRPSNQNHANEGVLSEHRDSDSRSGASQSVSFRQLILRIREDVVNMNDTLFKGDPRHGGSSPRSNWVLLKEILEFRRNVVSDSRAQHFPIDSQNKPGIRTAQSRRVLDEGFENRIEVKRRSAYNLENFTCGG